MTDKELRHKTGLINLYVGQLQDESSEYMRIVLRAAIRKLSSGVKPKKVEDWVVKLEKIWREI